MPSLQAFAHRQLDVLESKRLKRALRAAPGEGVVSFSSNDYLGLSRHPQVIAAAQEALIAYGAGAGASRLVTGNVALYDALEALLAEMHGTEAACVLGSGYLANMGVIGALAGKNDLILADRLAHASMLDGARLSGGTLMRFAHNNVAHCAELLAAHRGEFQHCLILTEQVFSMDGDLAPLGALEALARGHDAWLVVDSAHGLGVTAHAEADIIIGTLSKAAGSYGGYVCASKAVIDYVVNAARSLMFSTGLPPATLAAGREALAIIREGRTLGARALGNARHFTALLGLEEAQSAIVPLVLGEPERALAASAMLEAEGFRVAAIRPPAVPPGASRLRFAFSAQHRMEDIARAAMLLQKHGYA